MSNSEKLEVPVPIVKVLSSSSASTSVDKSTDDNSSTSSDESVGTSAGQTLQTNDDIFVVPIVQTSINDSFDGLTIPVVVPLDPNFPRTTYTNVTTTDLTTRELLDPNILHREGANFDSSKELSKTKKRLPRDFILKNNTLGLALSILALEVDRSMFRCSICQHVWPCQTTHPHPN